MAFSFFNSSIRESSFSSCSRTQNRWFQRDFVSGIIAPVGVFFRKKVSGRKIGTTRNSFRETLLSGDPKKNECVKSEWSAEIMAETKYEELWRIYNEERKQHVDYKNSCLDFTDKFFEAFARYIGGPRERLRFSPLNDMGDWNPTPHGTMRVEDDGRLSTCMMLELGPAPDPKVTRLGMSELQIPVYVSKDTTGFRIQVGDTPTRSFTSAEDAARQSFFDVICERFKRHLHESLTLEVVPKQIGFHRD